jgi:FtsH-binding integral membrane protein
MIVWSQGERLKREAAEIRRESVSMAFVLSVTMALASVAIVSRNPHTGDPWIELAACAAPIILGFYFRKRIGQLGSFAYAAALVLVLSAALLFGT